MVRAIDKGSGHTWLASGKICTRHPGHLSRSNAFAQHRIQQLDRDSQPTTKRPAQTAIARPTRKIEHTRSLTPVLDHRSVPTTPLLEGFSGSELYHDISPSTI